jgi:transcriptional regulator with XRE-family HTH domain
MTSTEDRLAKIKAALLAQKQATLERLRHASEHGIDYNADRRAENLRILRAFLNATQDEQASLLGIASQPQYSQLERGEQGLESDEARQMERALGIPEYWLDRVNAQALFMTQDELSLINEIRRAKPGAALLLANAVKGLTA